MSSSSIQTVLNQRAYLLFYTRDSPDDRTLPTGNGLRPENGLAGSSGVARQPVTGPVYGSRPNTLTGHNSKTTGLFGLNNNNKRPVESPLSVANRLPPTLTSVVQQPSLITTSGMGGGTVNKLPGVQAA